ncbi:MAG: MgtC/SapB family protein [Fusobacterium sp. JB021]|nr:MgtC/SapB family protein [Fusobacterium sp. JB020]MDP0492874.1 MgtC/SapB family protein [Fusobacterium sp. JB021]MDP0507372.1 MgtC/SapB family protein [Fusobacterium sp. JB019]
MTPFDLTLGNAQIFIRIFTAIIIGGMIGYERGCNNRPAGFRTHILVCLGAAIVSLIQEQLRVNIIKLAIDNPSLGENFKSDLGRLGAQVISGIGFLGAGTIMKERGTIEGLTTAASLWATGCIGLGIGWGFYTLSITSGIAVMIVLVTLKKLEVSVIDNKHTVKLEVIFTEENNYGENILMIYELLKCSNLKSKIKDIKKDSDENKARYILIMPKQLKPIDLISEIAKSPCVKQVTRL